MLLMLWTTRWACVVQRVYWIIGRCEVYCVGHTVRQINSLVVCTRGENDELIFALHNLSNHKEISQRKREKMNRNLLRVVEER